jgi:hypothetical protein
MLRCGVGRGVDLKINDDMKQETGNCKKGPVGVTHVLPMAPAGFSACDDRVSLPRLGQPFVLGSLENAAGQVPRISSFLTWRDHWGTVKARWGVGRMTYEIDPGLYALGNPDKRSPVLVTANYKMSFDCLRNTLPGRSAWLLVLDTAGINVWCAAGKGTFGTTELIHRIAVSGLDQIVSHRQLILPQLAGPGIAAHQVKKYSGFTVHYGPIRASDLPAYIDAGLRATPQMRIKTFSLKERAILIPIELVSALKAGTLLMILFLVLSGLGGPDGYVENMKNYGLFSAGSILTAILAGTILTPLLLPVLPGRAFSIKGAIVGLATVTGILLYRNGGLESWTGRFEALAWVLLVTAITAYLAMNFTGASTYTSLSGVKKEMRIALPLEISACIAGFCLWLLSRFTA